MIKLNKTTFTKQKQQQQNACQLLIYVINFEMLLDGSEQQQLKSQTTCL